MSQFIAFISGVIFAVGLAIGGMTQPHKVLAFLDLFGKWDASLAFVMGGAIAVYMPIYWLARRRLGGRLQLPAAQRPDRRLLVGAAMFGVGWGLVGYCPGPALVSLSTLTRPALIFGAAMLAGMFLHGRLGRR